MLSQSLSVAVGDLGQFFDGCCLNMFETMNHSLHVDQFAGVARLRSAAADAVARRCLLVGTLARLGADGIGVRALPLCRGQGRRHVWTSTLVS